MQVHYSSKKHDWATPWDFFCSVFETYGFKIDACASEENAKVYPFISESQNSLITSWGCGPVWYNPPYGSEQIEFVKKAKSERDTNGVTTVLLIPARPDTKIWQDTIFPDADAICFVRGRIKFGGGKESAPFPSALVIFGEVRDLSKIGHMVRKD